MSFPVKYSILKNLEHEEFKPSQKNYSHMERDPEREISVNLSKLGDDAIHELSKAFEKDGNLRHTKMLNSILESRLGKKDQTVKGIEILADLLRDYLKKEEVNKWIFQRESDGQLYPYLVTRIEYRDKENFRSNAEEPHVKMSLVAYGISSNNDKMSTKTTEICFYKRHVSNRKLSTLLADFDLFMETQELVDAHEKQVERYREIIMPGFAAQFVADGNTVRIGYGSKGVRLNKARVIHDLSASDFGAFNDMMDVEVKTENGSNDVGVYPCPMHPMVRVFNLESHDFHWINANMVEPYVYKDLLKHLILPESHHDLLDMLTDDLTDFSHDFVEGKTAGNLIICKGPPGVGKTLTAELYSESKKVPLIILRAGKLGTTVSEVSKGLKQYLEWAARWNCPLLINEADIYVAKRGDNIDLNAIVAELLQLVEYYVGLLFMTTNRPNDIDDAFISRALAIINYDAPKGDLVTDSWRQIASLHGVEMDADMIEKLKLLFPTIVQRDMKMLLKLALKSSKRSGKEITVDLLRKMAMFRDIKMADNVAELVK